MSGHSKWATIKQKKGAADAKRGQLFSKLSRAIMVAAKEGGPDPEANLALQNAIQKARDARCRRTTSSGRSRRRRRGATARAYETVVYEGYGPGGVAVIVEALTDNRNRTAAELRHIFTKNGGYLGAPGASPGSSTARASSSSPRRRGRGRARARRRRRGRGRRRATASHWQVTRPGRPHGRARAPSRGRGRVELGRADHGAQDHGRDRRGATAQIVRLVEGLEDNDDVQDVYANFDIPRRCWRPWRRKRRCGRGPIRVGTSRGTRRARDAQRAPSGTCPRGRRRIERGGIPLLREPAARSVRRAVRGSVPSRREVLGIDPGTAACGYGIVHESDGRIRASPRVLDVRARERPELRLRTIFDGVAGLIRARAGRRRARGVVRRCRRPHRALRRAGARRRARRGRVGRSRVHRVRAGPRQAGGVRLRPRREGPGARMVRSCSRWRPSRATSHEADALAVAICHALAAARAACAS